jgi:surfactin synthase thioesterase subunit
VLIGELDNMLSEADRKWAQEHLNDVRVIDTDHFIIFRHPELLAQRVLNFLGRTT